MKKYFKMMRELWKLLKPFHSYFYKQFFLTVIIQATVVILTLNISKIIDNAVSGNWKYVLYFLISYLVLVMIDQIFNYIKETQFFKNSFGEMRNYVQEYSLKRILKLNASQYVEDHSAVKQHIIDRGERSLITMMGSLFLSIIPLVLTFIFSLTAISFYSSDIGLFSILVLILIIIFTARHNKILKPIIKIDVSNWDKQRKIRVEAFEHLKLIKLNGMEKFYTIKYMKHRIDLISFSVSLSLKNLNFATIRDISIDIAKYFSLAMSIYLFYKGEISIGIVYAIFSWVGNTYGQLSRLNRQLRDIPQEIVYIEKYLEIMSIEPSFNEEGKNKFVQGDIEFDNVDFKYPKGDKNVLENLSFKIKEGTKVAFVGYSGSGKTTITQLLLRSYDYTDGQIKIGDIDLKEMSANSLREHVGYVEQHVDLFDDTIKNNILFGIKDEEVLKNLEEDDTKLEEIAKKARIDQFYHRLGEDKFDTMIGERGIKLSGGERQRVGIARALIKDPAILIFDEATSALDAENEKYIKEAIEEASVGRTTIIIAHRLSTVRDVDEIFMMSNGKILARGTHNELLKKSKEYKDLVEAQMH